MRCRSRSAVRPMAELTPGDVEAYTQGRLDRDDAETARCLAAALSAARRYCGWNVTEVVDDEVTLDGPAGSLLVLPTLHLTQLVSVVEDGVTLNLDDLYTSSRGLVRKRSGGTWSRHFGAITVVMTHGYADAPDFNAAILSAVDRISMGGAPRVIGPFQYETDGTADELTVLDRYRLEKAP